MYIIFLPLSEGIAFLYSFGLFCTVLIVTSPPLHSNVSFHKVLLNVIPSVLVNLNTAADKLPLVRKSLGRESTSMFFGSQFIICACLSHIHVEIPAGPGLFSLANMHDT